MPTLDEITDCVREWSRYPGELSAGSNLQRDIGLYGDDLSEFLQKYAHRFAVDMSQYMWYFHTGEESFNLGGFLFPPPDARVEEIPITLEMLREAAEHGTWCIEYPDHSVPARRYDVMINRAVFVIAVAFLVYGLVYGIFW